MDTPGGNADSAQKIVQALQFITVPTHTFVERNALSAGAHIAMATKRIYMAPGSSIGAAKPMLVSPIGGVQQLPEAVDEKFTSAYASMVRAAAQLGGHDPEIAEAMVRREKELKIGDTVISPAGELLTLTYEEAARVYEGRDGPLLSSGTVKDLDALLEAIGFAGAEVRTFEVTSAERLARFIAALAPLFLIAGALGLYLEFRTPGFGLPGILGILSLAIFFWGHHIAGLAGSEELLLFAIGLAFLLVEIFVIPGFGIAGVTGIALMAAGILLSMVHRPPAGPWWPAWSGLTLPLRNLSIAIVGTAVGGALLGRLLPHTPMFRKLVLAASTARAAGFSAAPDRPELVGRAGEAATALRPAGIAHIDGHRLDVVSEGGFVEAGDGVRVLRVEGSRVFVAPVDRAGGSDA
jgi:membrane-bound serine protease (ClpP class)